MSSFEPFATKLTQLKFINQDKFNKYTFAITEEQYEKIKKLTTTHGKYSPVSKYEYNDKIYFNLKIKTTAVHQKFDITKLKNKTLKCKVSFFAWDYMNKTGSRAEIDSFIIVETDNPAFTKPDRSKRTYDADFDSLIKEDDEIDEIELPEI
jgi:hypothetical protein